MAATVSVMLALFVLAVAATLTLALFGWAFHLVFFVARIAVIVGLIAIGVRLLTRSRR